MPHSGAHRANGTRKFTVRRLNETSETGWAVIAEPSGAIALAGERLLMRLPREEAERIAERMTRELVQDDAR